jgi:hypothetical protein
MMPGRLAVSSEASSPRLLVLDGDTSHEVFDLVNLTGAVIRARSALLFEVGEELCLQIEQGGSVWVATARVIAHTGTDPDRVTELEISDRSEPSAAASE